MSSTRGVIIASRAAHSSVNQAAQVMDVDVVWAQDDDRGRLSGEAVRAAWQSLSAEQQRRTFCVVATGGTTNVGIVDDLEGVGQFSAAHGLWFHVDAAYGGAALAAPSVRELFNGIERADSLIVDPHKWLFAPFDSCALLYRDPRVARAAHTQHAEYLDALRHDDDWNPSDYAHHLTRRARGLPLWFSLAVHGTVAYSESVERSLTVTREGADDIRMSSHLELVLEPELSVLVFRRRGWTTEQYYAWSDKVLTDGLAFVVPTSWRGETVLRMCLVNPATTRDDLRLVFDSLK
jgi:glutamate/tyrosine decarboxylase-like PLP-dependent enzyme